MSKEIIRCLLIAHEPTESFHPPDFQLEYFDGTKVPVEEVDIGQDKWPYKWPEHQREFTWKLLNHTPDIANELMQVRSFQAAFNSIQKLTTIDIDYLQYVNDQDFQTDFTIEFFQDLDAFGNREGIIAQAYLYHPNSNLNGVIQFNDLTHIFTPLGWPVKARDVDPDNYPSDDLTMFHTQSLVHVGMHEIMHAFGYRHDLSNRDSVMYPYAKPGYLKGKINKDAFMWHERDVHRLRDAYGNSHIPAWILTRWQKYRMTRSRFER